MALPLFAVDFDGTLVSDEHYPEIGEWIPGAADAVRELEGYGDVIIYTCRVASEAYRTYEPRTQDEVNEEIRLIRAKLAEEGLEHLPIWTKPFKPPADAYIDNKAVRFDGDWEDVLDQSLHLANGSWVPPRHPNSKRFHEILYNLGKLHDRKQADYGRGDDPFANVRGSEEWGVKSWVGAMVRATDKVRRLQTFASKGTLMNEPALDAFDDLAVYAIIARVLYEEERAASMTPEARRSAFNGDWVV